MTIMFRMPTSQPPTDAITIVRAGRMPCCRTLARKGPLKPGSMSPSYPPLVGSQLSCTPKTRTRMRATQKNGSDPMNMDAGVMNESKRDPTREPDTTPAAVPRTKDRTEVSPTRPTVQGSPVRITSHTGVG